MTGKSKHKLEDNASSAPTKVPKTDDVKQTTLDDTFVSGNKEAGEIEKAGEQGKEQKSGEKTKQTSQDGERKSQVKKEDGAVELHARDAAAPSNMLEKGIIYFFLRGRVGIDHPENVSDIARSYFILRPIPKDAKLGEGPIGDACNSRLIAVPKKVFPQSGRERWIAFVEKTDTSWETLRTEFLASTDYDTKTAGVRHSPAANPIGEGVYAFTTTGRENHLSYLLTLPDELGDVQIEMGLKKRGSWIVSTRNPQYPAPQNTALPEGPDFSKEILDEFRSLRWMATLPKHLVPNAQFLLVGESSGIDKAMQPDDKDKKHSNTAQPLEEMEQLQDEDTERMEHLGNDDSEAIFADLEAQAKDFPKLQTDF